MKSDHRAILIFLENYLIGHEECRFGQALSNLNINQFANQTNTDGKLRDIYNDKDEDILKRIKLP